MVAGGLGEEGVQSEGGAAEGDHQKARLAEGGGGEQGHVLQGTLREIKNHLLKHTLTIQLITQKIQNTQI